MTGFTAWLAARRADVEDAQPLSLQTTIGRLTTRLHTLESALRLVMQLHQADEFGDMCVGCYRPWPCATFQLLDPVSACPSRCPWTSATCAKSLGHRDLHGGFDHTGAWQTWS